MRAAFGSVAIQAAGSAATVGAALLVASQMGLAAQGEFGLLRSWSDALVTLAVLGLPQALLHLQYRESVSIAPLRRWIDRYVLVVVVISVSVGLIAAILLARRPALGGPAPATLIVLAAVVPLAALHLLWRALALRNVGAAAYAGITAAPSVLILLGLLPVAFFGWRQALVWPLLAGAAVSAGLTGWVVHHAARREAARPPHDLASDSTAGFSRRTLWAVGVENGVQNVLTAIAPALMMSAAAAAGATLTQIGVVSLGLHVYQLFGVAAAYLAPLLYDRAARADRAPGNRQILRKFRNEATPARIATGIAGAVAALLVLRAVLPVGADALPLLLGMALAGALSMAVRLLVTLMLARGVMRPLTLQAVVRVAVSVGGMVLLMQVLPAPAAAPLALVACEAVLLAMLLPWVRRSDPASAVDPRHDGGGTAGPGLVLVTTNHPHTHTGGETMFVGPELRRLATAVEKVRVVPQHAEGLQLDLPDGVEVDRSLFKALRRARWSRYAAAPFWPGFGAELARALRRGGVVGCVRVWRWAGLAHVTYRWARSAFPPGAPLLFYTYWRGGSTLALARIASERPRTAVITRVHRYELYEDAFAPPFQPWHPSLYGAMARTAAISQHGFDYLRTAGVAENRLWLARLGTEAAPSPASGSHDGVLRIVSCSAITAVKRVPAIADSLSALALRHPSRRFEWTHFGGGPELGAVRAVLAARGPANLATDLRGQVGNEVVLAHYASRPVDLFISLSASEGLPVSIQEAIGAGLPVLATDVGGVGEAVGPANGVLLRASASTTEVVDALERCVLDADESTRQAMRAESLRLWHRDFDAGRNHERFAAQVRALQESL